MDEPGVKVEGVKRSPRRQLFDFLAFVSLIGLVGMLVLTAVGMFHAITIPWRKTSADVYFVQFDGSRIVLAEQSMTAGNKNGLGRLDTTQLGKLQATMNTGPYSGMITFGLSNLVTKHFLGFGTASMHPGIILPLSYSGIPNRAAGNFVAKAIVNVVFVPIWAAYVTLAILPGIWFWRWRRDQARRETGLCKVCGYDLRATPERCPECGTATSARIVLAST